MAKLKAYTRFRIELFDKDGEKVYDKTVVNDLTANGITKLRGMISGVGTAVTLAKIGIGDSDTPTNDTHTDLQASANKLWKTITTRETVSGEDLIRISLTTNEGNFTINEIGLQASDGSLIARSVQENPDDPKNNTQSGTVSWAVVVSEDTT